MSRLRLAPLGSLQQRMIWWALWALGGLPWTFMFRWKPGAHAQVPRDGPFLLVANHASMFDPVWVAFWLFRRSSFLTSSALFSVPVLGRLLPLCGCIPKTKFNKDPEAMQALAERYEAGDVIVLFPEGTRSWDGRPGQTLDGIGRLVKRLNARVVTARILNGHLFHPRWARWPRWMPIRVEYDEARTYPEDMSAEAITAQIAQRITINPIVQPQGLFRTFVPGYRRAEGLPTYLWACPSCFAIGGLHVPKADGDRIDCSSCAQTWQLDSYNNMKGTSPQRVDEAFDRLADHFGDPPWSNPGSAEGSAALEEAGALSLLGAKRRRGETHTGTLRLGPEGLSVVGPDGVLWSRQLSELRSVSVEVQNQLTVRTGQELVEILVEPGSALKWWHFLKQWVEAADAPGRAVS